jgi:hypothetical protein
VTIEELASERRIPSETLEKEKKVYKKGGCPPADKGSSNKSNVLLRVFNRPLVRKSSLGSQALNVSGSFLN